MRVSPLFSTIFLLIFAFQLHAESGVISSVKNGTFTYFTPKAEYRVEVNSLPQNERERVEAYLKEVNPNQDGVIPYVERKAIELKVGDHFLLAEEDEDGLRPNCNEIPVEPEEIIELANSFPKGGMVDFLNAIPEGSLQVFTMMKETKSKQHHEVSAQNPRIIRTNADGSFFMSFVCDPKSQDYGKIEIMTFDRSEDRFKMATIDFTNNPDSKIPTHDEMKFSHLSNNEDSYKNQHRVNRNPKACLKCHSSDPTATIPDPRPLWQEYNTWPGAYGANDDVIDHLYDEEDLESLVELKKNNQNNPCYQSLPMPKELSEPIPEDFGEVSYESDWLYPYQERRSNNYERRPNFRITDTLSRHAARRMGRLFYDSPGYEKIKIESLMGTFNCPQISDYSKVFKSAVPHYQKPEHDPKDQRETKELMND
ncbi:MAG: hypothetical protein NXH75_10590, partial [Halobacteriovoraceae bacterium]|nr:hypothetical protein [Halobacteriovoraceae bacterium]